MTPKFYYISFSEYDLGQEGVIFKSHSDALKFGEEQFEKSVDESWDDYVNAGFFEVDEVTIYNDE